MSKLIIVEGPDKSGKTSLAKRICFLKKGFYFHSTWTPGLGACIHDYFKNIQENVMWNLSNDATVVLDRFYISEIVYGTAVRNQMLDLSLVKEYEDWVKAWKGIEVFCENLDHCNGPDSDHGYTTQQVNQIHVGYKLIRPIDAKIYTSDMWPTMDKFIETLYE